MWLYSVLGWWITKCGNSGLQSVLGVGLRSVAKWIGKCVKDYKVWQGGLQSASGITKCGGITKWVSAFTLLSDLKNSSLLMHLDIYNK